MWPAGRGLLITEVEDADKFINPCDKSRPKRIRIHMHSRVALKYILLSFQAEWIRANNFGGAMILSLNVDDWNNTCKFDATFPLTRIVNKVLRSQED